MSMSDIEAHRPSDSIYGSPPEPPLGDGEVAASRCSRKAIATALAASVLIVGAICAAALLLHDGKPAPPPTQLTVDSISPSGLNSTFTEDNTTVTASTSNSSFAAVVDGRALFAKQREVHAGYPVVRTRILDASFVTLTTAQNRSVTVEASPDAPLSEPFLRLIYDESPDIQPALKQAAAAQDAAMDAILTEHKQELNAFVDMAWNLGESMHISSTEYPHMLEVYTLAKELSKDMDRPPLTIEADASSTVEDEDGRRRLQSGCSCSSTYPTCGGDGWCYDGSDYGGGAGCGERFGDSCGQSHTAAAASSDHWAHRQDSCSLESDPNGDECDGMCGYGCNCWSFVCGDCCSHRLCADHDSCCRRLGTASSACTNILTEYAFYQCSDSYRGGC